MRPETFGSCEKDEKFALISGQMCLATGTKQGDEQLEEMNVQWALSRCLIFNESWRDNIMMMMNSGMELERKKVLDNLSCFGGKWG